jgi:hypothetical protein
VDDSRNGYGVYTYSLDSSPEFARYEGQWARGLKSGNGTLYR